MAHALVFKEENDTNHVFTCTKCGAVIGFNKPGLGEPNAIDVNGTWTPPEDADLYLGPCPVEG